MYEGSPQVLYTTLLALARSIEPSDFLPVQISSPKFKIDPMNPGGSNLTIPSIRSFTTQSLGTGDFQASESSQ